MKRTVLILIATLLIATMYAQTPIPNSNLTWKLENDTLIISGTGVMPDFSDSDYDYAPWYNYSSLIKTVIIGDSITTIGNFAFRGCFDITSIHISSSVTTIGFNALLHSPRLTEFIVEEENVFYKVVDGVLFTINQDTLIHFPSAKSATTYSIPNSVTTIADYAFFNHDLTRINIPNSVTTIRDGAFVGCYYLRYINIEATVPPTLGNYAFFGTQYPVLVCVPRRSAKIYRKTEGWRNFNVKKIKRNGKQRMYWKPRSVVEHIT